MELLLETIILKPQIRTKVDLDELCFLEDGAPPHYSPTVREYLRQACPQHWVGWRVCIEWPPSSPDLTPMSFFLSVVKNMLYERNHHTVNELKEYISDAFKEIDGDWNLCRTVCQGVLDRYEDCYRVEGDHFEHM